MRGFRIIPGAHLRRASPGGMAGLGAIFETSPYAGPFADSRASPEAPDDARTLSRLALEPPGVPAPLSDAPEISAQGLRMPPFTQPAAIPVRDELRYGRTNNVPLSIGVASARIITAPPPNTRRTFLFIVNTHAVQILFLNFGDTATALNGIQINPGNGAIGFDAFVPQDDIFLIANGVLTTGILSFSNRGVNDYPALPE